MARRNDMLAHTHGRPVDIHAVRLSGDRDSKPAAFALLVRSWFGRSVVSFESTDVLAPNGFYLSGSKIFVNVDSDHPLREVIGHELLHSIRLNHSGL